MFKTQVQPCLASVGLLHLFSYKGHLAPAGREGMTRCPHPRPAPSLSFRSSPLVYFHKFVGKEQIHPRENPMSSTHTWFGWCLKATLNLKLILEGAEMLGVLGWAGNTLQGRGNGIWKTPKANCILCLPLTWMSLRPLRLCFSWFAIWDLCIFFG